MRVIGIAAALAVAVGMSGCTTTAEPPTPSASPSVDSDAPTPLTVPDGIVATAPLLDRDGAVLGEVQVVADDGRFDLVLPDVDIDPLGSRLMIALSDGTVHPSSCAVYQIGFETNDAGPGPSFDLTPWPQDPTYWKTVMYLPYEVAPDENGCRQPVLAAAHLVWTLPVSRPWVVPQDGGTRSGAAGAVVMDGAALSTYLTAAGDVWTEIAVRFGISAEDLDWLNPIRAGNSAPGTAYADQVLNLDPTERGNSETRRPR